jgi:hypothetical protein
MAEVVVTTLVASIIFLGLAIAYLFGMDAWEKTARRISMQQAGTLIVNELTRRVQPARSWHIDPARLTVTADTAITVVEMRKERLFIDGAEFPGWSDADSLAFRAASDAPVFRLTNRNNLLEMSFVIASLSRNQPEELRFTTRICRRN